MVYVVLFFIGVIVLSLFFGKSQQNLDGEEENVTPKEKPKKVSVQRVGDTGAFENVTLSLYEDKIMVGNMEIIS